MCQVKQRTVIPPIDKDPRENRTRNFELLSEHAPDLIDRPEHHSGGAVVPLSSGKVLNSMLATFFDQHVGVADRVGIRVELLAEQCPRWSRSKSR